MPMRLISNNDAPPERTETRAACDRRIEGWIGPIADRAPLLQQRTRSMGSERCASLSPASALGFLRCMDLSRPVARVTLLPGERIIGYRGPAESQFKLFFSRPGRAV